MNFMDNLTSEQDDVPLLFCEGDITSRKEIYTENLGHINEIPTELEENLQNRDCVLKQRIPSLPEGVDRYFFVSHSSEDSDRVFSCVQNLESRFDLSCVYADRDFQPGKDISENIKEGMARSLKVLLFLSPNFQQSGWCKFERDFAFINSIENGSSCIIPIILQECEVPATLKTLTYIDATHPDTDVAARIVKALVETYEADGFLPLEFTSPMRKYESGYSFNISAGREETCCPCSPARYQFEVVPELFRMLKNKKVELPEMLVQETIAMVNSASVMTSYDYLKRCNICIWGLMSLPFFIAFTIFGIEAQELTYTSRTRLTQDDLDALTYAPITGTAALIAAIFLTLLVCVIVIPICCHKKQRDVLLQQKIWKSFGEQFISNNALILFSGRKNKLPSLHFMRYNFAKCTEYLVDVIKSKYPEIESNDCEAMASSYIREHVYDVMTVLADDFESLPDAPFNRHNVKKGKMCLCQYIELNVLHCDANT